MIAEAPGERLVSEERLRDKVTGWYTACPETVAEQDNVSERVFTSCPFLCRKGDMRQYVANEPRYPDDDNDLAKAFAEDVWLFHIPARLAADAEIDRCLREYTARPAEEEHDEGRGKPTKDEQGGSTSQAPSSGGSQVQQGKQSLSAHPGETSEGTSSGSRDSVKQPLRLTTVPTFKFHLNLTVA